MKGLQLLEKPQINQIIFRQNKHMNADTSISGFIYKYIYT